MSVSTSAGSTLAIATGSPATYDAAGYAALTFVVVGEVTNLGEFGRMYATVNHSPVGTRRVQKFKGSYNGGSMNIQMGRDVTNVGQIAMAAALLSDADYSIKVTTQDGTKFFFGGKVTEFKHTIGTVDQITGNTTIIEINSDIVEI